MQPFVTVAVSALGIAIAISETCCFAVDKMRSVAKSPGQLKTNYVVDVQQHQCSVVANAILRTL